MIPLLPRTALHSASVPVSGRPRFLVALTRAAAVLVLLVASTEAALASPASCAAAIAKAADRHLQERSREIAYCAGDAIRAGDPASAATCSQDPELASLDEALAASIASACGGSDGTCGGGDDEPLASIGWDLATCPDLAGAGCNLPIEDCGSIAACLACTSAAATDAVAAVTAADLTPTTEPAILGCQRALATGADKSLRTAARSLAKCQARVASGLIAGPCPDPKSQSLLAKKAAKAAAKTCRACGGDDRGCDSATAGVPGTGGSDDPLSSEVSSASRCPALVVPSNGRDCDAALDSAGDLVECTDCVIAYAGECAAAVARRDAGPYPAECTGASTSDCPDCLPWSDPDTWGGTLPAEGHEVVIPSDRRVLLDIDTPALAGLSVDGELHFARKDLTLTADWIMVHGTLAVGSTAEPFQHNAVITLTAEDPDQQAMGMGMGTRGIMVMGGGTLSLHGAPPAVAWTKIDEHVDAGETDMTLVEDVGWEAGDQIVLAPTDFHTFEPTPALAVTERLTLASSAAGDTITTTEGPEVARWGLLQYPTAAGMALAPDDSIVLPPEMEGTPMVLDERAEIGNLTRNIVIEAPDDDLWRDQGFGVHVMVMGSGSAAYLDGVEIRRGGQRGELGRYPFHWHMLSYAPPLWIGDATGQYIRNSVIHESANRGIVVHGTNGVLVQNNIVYDVRGHGIFTEDASERRNVFDHNLVLRVRDPEIDDALKMHELEAGSPGVPGGSSGFWISNPDNTITNNTAADTGAFGFWLPFTFRVWGASAPTLETRVPITPQNIALTAFDSNTSHSTRYSGLMLDEVESDSDGRVAVPGTPQQYIPSDAEDGYFGNPAAAYANRVPFELTRFTVWKSGEHGIWDRASGPRNREIVSADNCQKFFAGSGEDGLIERSLVVGNSLNSASARPWQAGDPTPSAFATYHSAFDIRDNLVLHFPLAPGQTSGVFAEDDFYFRPVEKGTVRNSGNLILHSHPGYKSVALNSGTGGYQPFASWFNFAPAKWDPHGWAGPAGNWLVYDTPFLTHDQPAIPVAPDSTASGAVSVPGPFYGFTAFVLHGLGDTLPQNRDYDDLMEIDVRRLDENLDEVGTWNVAGVCCSDTLLAHMRDFAAHADGIYELDFPFNEFNPGWGFGLEHPTDLRMEVENMLTTDDTLVIGVQFDGSIPANVWLSSPGNPYVPYTDLGAGDPMAGLDDVIASEGGTYWQDTANNRVWMKLRGGTWLPGGWAEFVLTPDMLLYETTLVRITGP